MNSSSSNPKSNRKSGILPSRSGALVVFGLLVFGALILGGLYIVPHAPKAPVVPMGVPARTLRFLSYDLARQHPTNDPLFSAVKDLNPDYVLLQGVNEDDAAEIAELLHMQESFHPQLYQRSEHLAGRHGTWGNMILSRQSLYQGAPLGGKRGGYGAWAESVVDGRGFFVACVHLSAGEGAAPEVGDLQQTWTSVGSAPMVIAVLPSDPMLPSGMASFPVAVHANGEWFCLSKEWTVQKQGSASVGANGLAPFWIDVAAAR